MSILRRITDFILQNRLPAMGVAFVLAYVPYLGSLSVIIAAFVTLRKGAFEGGLVFLAATLAVLLIYFSQQSDGIALGWMLLNVLTNVLVWLFAVLLSRYENWGFIVDCSILIGVVFIGFLHFTYPDIQNFWATRLTQYIDQLIASGNGEGITPESRQQMIDVSHYAGGLLTAFVLLNAILQLMLARWWQGLVFNPGGLRQELYNIRLSHVIGVLFIIFLVLAYMNNPIAIDIMPVIYLLFAVSGFSLMHYMLAPRKYSWLWLLIMYAVAIRFFPQSGLLISFVTFLDIWFNFRQRRIS